MPKKAAVKEKPINEKLELWQGRISTMKTYMENAKAKKRWKRLIQFYRNDYTSALNLKKNVAIIVINLVKSFVRSAVADLFVRTPKFKCTPKRTDSILKARVGEVAINYYWYDKKIKRQVKKCLKEAKLLGYSWIKVGYEGTIGSYGDEENNEFVKNEDIFAVYCKHDSVWYDPLAQDAPFDCGWMIHTYLKPTDVLAKKYGKKINPTSKNFYSNTKDNLLKPKDTEMSRVYEIWDKDNDEILLYCDGYEDGFLEEKVWSKVYDDPTFPFSLLTFDTAIDLGDEVEDNLPEPEINDFIDQILEKIKFRSLQISHIKRFSRQLLANKDKFTDEAEQKKFTDGLDGAIILVDGDPATTIMPVQYPAIQPDIYAIENKIDMDMDRVSGRPAFTAGMPTQTRTRTLGEMEMMQGGANSRLSEEQDTMEEFTEEVARKILRKMRQFLDKDMYARIVADMTPLDMALFKSKNLLDGTTVKFNKDYLPSEEDGDIEIVAGSTMPLNPQTRMEKLMAAAKFGPAFGLVPGTMASMYLGQAMMMEWELTDVAKAYSIDIQKALQPKQPTAEDQFKQLSMKQKIDRDAADIALKKTRVEGNNLANVSKALKNAEGLSPKPTEKPGKPQGSTTPKKGADEV